MTGDKTRFSPVQQVTEESLNFTKVENIRDFRWQCAQEKYEESSSKHLSKLNPSGILSRGLEAVKKGTDTRVETQTLYFTDLKSGRCGFIQLLYSNVMGGLYNAFQLNFKVFRADEGGENIDIWESFKVEKVKEFTEYRMESEQVTFELLQGKAGSTGMLNIQVDIKKSGYKQDLYIDLEVELGVGFKVNPDGSNYYFEKPTSVPSTSRKKVRHVFSPRGSCDGMISYHKDGKLVELSLVQTPVLFIEALQGLKPNSAARSWNFMCYQSENFSSVCMEFTTTEHYGNVTVTVGCISHKGDIVSVYSQSGKNGSHVKLMETDKDEENGWHYPLSISIPLGGGYQFVEDHLKLVNKYDIMNELPNIVKKVVENIVGIKPYIYQYCQRSDLCEEKGISIVESTFIS